MLKSYLNWIGISIFLFTVVGNGSAGNSRMLLSVEEIEQLIPQIEAVESSILNIKIESEAWREESESPDGPWGRTPVDISATSWFSGQPNSKARMDVHSENIKVYEKDSGHPMHRSKSYTASYDGQLGKMLYKEQEVNGKVEHLNRGKISNKAPEILNGKRSGVVSGFRLTTSYFFVDKKQNESFSQYFRIAISPEALKSNSFEIAREEYNGIQCISFSLTGSKTLRMTWWFDPSRGFALLGHEKIRKNEDGTNFVEECIKVNKLRKVSKNIWWPVEGTIESDRRKVGEPYARTVYRAFDVTVNHPDFDKSIFSLSFPAGCLIDDKVENRQYRVPKNGKGN